MATYPSPTLQNVTVNGAATLTSVSTAAATVTGGTINGTSVGATTPAAATVTALVATTSASVPDAVSATQPLTFGQVASTASGHGAALVGFLQSGTGAVAQTAQLKLLQMVSAFDFMTAAQISDVQAGTLTLDVTTACQNAINAAGTNGAVYFPPGSYLLSATLNGTTNLQMIGSGRNSTIFRRFTDYGNTLNFTNAGAASVRGIWFYHGTLYVSGNTSLSNKATNGAHINAVNCQGLIIEDCWLWRMPYQVNINAGALVKIRKCNMQGTWDETLTACQEGVASVIIGSTGYTQIVAIEDCYFGGSGSSARSLSWTSSDTGLHTFTGISENIGNQFAIEVVQCEDLLISNCYMGGNNTYNIYANLAASSVNLDWRIIGNFIDAARSACVSFNTQSNGVALTGLTISNNVFNGESQTTNAIVMYNPTGTAICVNNFAITGNSFQAFVGTEVILYHAANGSVNGNVFQGYNCRNVSAGGDPAYSAAANISSQSSHILCSSNIVGGNINGGALPSYCYQGILIGGGAVPGSIVERNTYWVGAGSGGAKYGRVDCTITPIGNATYTMNGGEDVITVSNSSVSIQVNLPTIVPPGYKFTIKDIAGNGATYPTQIVGTVDGALNPIFNTNYFTHSLIYTGTTWNILSN